MNPAGIIIARLGGEALVARITHTAYTAPYRWQAKRAKGGTGGLIPQRHHRTLIDYARGQGIPLSAEDFLPEPAVTEAVVPAKAGTQYPRASEADCGSCGHDAEPEAKV